MRFRRSRVFTQRLVKRRNEVARSYFVLLVTDSKAGVRGDCLHRLKAVSQSDAFSAVNDHCHTSWRRVFWRTTLRWTRNSPRMSVDATTSAWARV